MSRSPSSARQGRGDLLLAGLDIRPDRPDVVGHDADDDDREARERSRFEGPRRRRAVRGSPPVSFTITPDTFRDPWILSPQTPAVGERGDPPQRRRYRRLLRGSPARPGRTLHGPGADARPRRWRRGADAGGTSRRIDRLSRRRQEPVSRPHPAPTRSVRTRRRSRTRSSPRRPRKPRSISPRRSRRS